jgi:mono/diheme cytochrome c family protein
MRIVALALTVSIASATFAAAPDPEQGHELYRQFCESCHGADMITTSKLVFDLRRFPPSEADRFRNSVLNGTGGGMPAWRDSLTAEDVANLWAYVRSGAIR